MQLWTGLGNPGATYAQHRHNVGFMALDVIAVIHGFGPWQKKFRGLLSEGRIGSARVRLLKPQTFMNDSGDAVQQALNFFKQDIGSLTVFHDELDLAPMKVKVRTGGGLAGHNGLRSIDATFGPDFRRVRIGIATCDELGISTRPLGFVPRETDAKAAAIIASLAHREGAQALVIGLPLHANGDAGGNVRWVREFLEELAKVCEGW